MNKKLYVGNLSYQTTADQLENLFAQAGSVAEAVVIQDRETGRSKGFAFVEMADEAAATKAIEDLNGKDLDGRAISVAEAKPRREADNHRQSRW